MGYLFLIIAIVILLLSNILKVKRISQFVEPYEQPNNKLLTKSLAIGNTLNYILPFRFGYFFRAYISGKRMKNGTSFSLATILIEIFLDFLFVPIIYIVFYIFKQKSLNSILFYVTLLFIVFLILLLVKKFNKLVKNLIYRIASIFNEKIELRILKVFWFTITSFENIITRINKSRLFLYSISIWILNITSCYFLMLSLESFDVTKDLFGVFNLFYSDTGITMPYITRFWDLNNAEILVMSSYFLGSILLLYTVSFIINNKSEKSRYIEILPHVNTSDRLNFLESYFNNIDRDYLKKYIELNNDVAIIEDYSAGSNATTMLCRKDDKMFYRKYSVGKDAKKLYEQVEWIKNHKNKMELTDILYVYNKDDICLYDMPYVENAVTCFNYVHTMPFAEAWGTLKNVLNDLDKDLHSINRRNRDDELTSLYIDKKVTKNIELIEQGQYIKPLLKYEYIYINGKKYHNLTYFKEKYLNKDYLMKVFEKDEYSDIHGDFTIENIVCIKEKKRNKRKYYIIDPNTGNIHDSPYLDYAKLLQSIHGGYEFLMNTKNVSYHENKIDFLFTKSSTYYKLFDSVIDYLEKKYGEEALKSIFYHEVIHWLRLMPYKIEKIGDKSLLFYAGLIMVLSDVEKRFEK